MNRWWMLGGIVAWLTLAAFGLRWVFAPYFWVNAGTPCGCETRTIEHARQEFFIHVASFPELANATTALPASDEDEIEPADAATLNWAWRETMGRFMIGFVLWMGSGWFVHWYMGRITRGRTIKAA